MDLVLWQTLLQHMHRSEVIVMVSIFCKKELLVQPSLLPLTSLTFTLCHGYVPSHGQLSLSKTCIDLLITWHENEPMACKGGVSILQTTYIEWLWMHLPTASWTAWPAKDQASQKLYRRRTWATFFLRLLQSRQTFVCSNTSLIFCLTLLTSCSRCSV